ncbi:MAG: hypothetical protein WDA21_04400 [Bacilli bacterium]
MEKKTEWEKVVEDRTNKLYNEGNIQIKDYRIQYIKANPQKGFNFGYLLILPNNMRNHTMIIEGNNSQFKGNEKYYISEMLKYGVKYGDHPMLPVKAPIMVPLLEAWEEVKLYNKNATREEELYPQQLSRNTMLIKDPNDPNYRVDLQVLDMASDAREIIKNDYNFQLEDRYYLNGYSCSSSLALRLALIHPERIIGISTGGDGGLRPIPLEEFNGYKLHYPVGIFDFEKLFSKPFNEDAYRKINAFYYRGEDESKAMKTRIRDNGNGIYDDQYYNTANNRRLTDKNTGDLFNIVLGKRVEEKEANNELIYNQLGYNITHKTYPGGHTIDPGINTAIIDINNHYIKCVSQVYKDNFVK